MNTKTLTTPELVLVAGTRAALGAGAALLLADRLGKKQRARWVGRFSPLASLPPYPWQQLF